METSAGSGWRPLLEGADLARATEAIAAITAGLLAADGSGGEHPMRGLGLGSGGAGAALFLAYQAEGGGDPAGRGLALRLLDRCIRVAGGAPPGVSLCDGLAGIAWAVTHLRPLLPPVPGDPVTALDGVLAALLDDPGWEVEDELLYGLAGYGVWALERRPAAGEALAAVTRRLLDAAAEPVGPRWRPGSRPGTDLGVAHGSAGVVAVLARIAAHHPDPGLEAALDDAVAELLAQRDTSHPGTTIPPQVGYDLGQGTARTAWCYGDLGVAATLFSAARHLDRPGWEAAALAMAADVAERPPDEMRLLGTGLCHGAAAAAHCLNRIYQASGDPRLGDAARRWFRILLDQRRPGDGVGGYGAYTADGDGGVRWVASPGLLNGAAGVGLALLSAAAPVEPRWDHILAISPP